MSGAEVPAEARRAAEAAYTERLVALRLAEGGGFKVASQQRRAIAFALEAAAPYMMAKAWDEGWQKAHATEDPAMAGIFFNPYRPTNAG